MPSPPNYPPYQHPLLDERSRLVSRPWQMFFLSLVSNIDVASYLPPGSVGLDVLEPIDSPRLLGRGSPGVGPVEPITLGTGLAMTGTDLHVTSELAEVGYWAPITNGDPLSPEILFDSVGDCIVGFVPTA